jgi:hypothetical protein
MSNSSDIAIARKCSIEIEDSERLVHNNNNLIVCHISNIYEYIISLIGNY